MVKVKTNSRFRWIYVLLGALMMMLLGTVYSYSVFRLPIEEELQIGSALSGLPYMTALACYALSMFLTGKYIDSYPPPVILTVGGLLTALGWILSSFASGIGVLTLTYGVISGSGVGISYGVPMAVAARWFPERKGLAVGLILLGFGMSPLVTAPLAGFLIGRFGVLSAFRILGIAFAVLLPLLSLPFRFPAETPDAISRAGDSSEAPDISMREMLRTRSFKGLYLTFLIGAMIGLMMIGLTSTIGSGYAGVDMQELPGIISLFALMNGLGRPVFGWLADRLQAARTMLLSYSLILAAALLLLMAGSGNKVIFILAMSVFWFNLGGWLSIAPTSTSKLYGSRYHSRYYGLVFTAYGIGAVAGVLTSGLLLDAFGSYRYVFLYIIALCLLGIGLTLFLVRGSPHGDITTAAE